MWKVISFLFFVFWVFVIVVFCFLILLNSVCLGFTTSIVLGNAHTEIQC